MNASRPTIRRIIRFTESTAAVAAFYGNVVALELLLDETGWKE